MKAEIELPQLLVEGGLYELLIEVVQPNGQTDERPLNNKFRHIIFSLEDIPFEAEVEHIDNHAACEGASALIRASFGGNATIDWFDAPEEGNLLSSGNEFLVENLDSNNTYYAAARMHANTGIADPDPNQLEFSNEPDGGLLFDCYFPFTLKSLKIYPQSTGIVILNIKRKSGLGIASKMVVITEIKEHLVEWDVDVPRGVDLILSINNGISLSHSSEEVNYPYNVDAVMSIKSSTG